MRQIGAPCAGHGSDGEGGQRPFLRPQAPAARNVRSEQSGNQRGAVARVDDAVGGDVLSRSQARACCSAALRFDPGDLAIQPDLDA